MQRIDGTGVKATKDTYAADSSNSGYFEQGGSTVVTADWANSVQEELIAVQALRGASPDKTDDNQCATALNGIKALDAAASDTTNTTSTQTRAVLACNTGRASGAQSLSAACTGAHASGSNSAAVASGLATASGAQSASLASNAATVASDNSACIASLNCTTDAANEQNAVIASDDCDITGDESAIIASASSTGNGTVSGDQSALLATDNCDVSGDQSAAVASNTATVSADKAATLATGVCTASGTQSAVVASNDSVASATDSFVAASDTAINAAARAVLIGSNTELADDDTLSLGYSGTGITATGSNQNLTLQASIITGDVDTISGGTFNAGALDYAEMFENAEAVENGPGLLMSRRGTKCVPAKKGDRVLGVVSANPGVLGGAACLSWHGKHLSDEWGRYLRHEVEMVRWTELLEKTPDIIVQEGYTGPVADAPPDSVWPKDAKTYTGKFPRTRILEGPVRNGKPTRRVEHYEEKIECVSWPQVRRKQPAKVVRSAYSGPMADAPTPVPEDAEFYTRKTYIDNPDYVKGNGYQDRRKRPKEWTAIGLMGQLRVRVDASVGPDDYVVPGTVPGVGTSSKKPGKGRPVECMEIESPYEEGRGYAIAFCLVG